MNHNLQCETRTKDSNTCRQIYLQNPDKFTPVITNATVTKYRPTVATAVFYSMI